MSTQVLLCLRLLREWVPNVVALSSPDVFNYAMREAAYPLSGFKDIDSVTWRFPESSLITLRYRDKLYGLPEAIAFDMMFYRTDILEELGVSVPETWDDLIEISSVLANNNMENRRFVRREYLSYYAYAGGN